MEMLLSIREIAENRYSYVLQNLLVIHTWGGCGWTSAVFGRGKCTVIKLIYKSMEFQSCCATLVDKTASTTRVASAGSQIFVNMYEGNTDDILDSLGYIKYMEYAKTSAKKLEPEILPPTERVSVSKPQVIANLILADGVEK